jgi:hypothetical protein
VRVTTPRNKTADYLLSIGFEEQDNSVFMRKYRKHNGRIEVQLVTLNNEGEVVSGTIPPYQAITRSF